MLPLAMRNPSLFVPESSQIHMNTPSRLDSKLQNVMARCYQQYMVAYALVNPAGHELRGPANYNNDTLTSEQSDHNKWHSSSTQKELNEFQHIWDSWVGMKSGRKPTSIEPGITNMIRTQQTNALLNGFADPSRGETQMGHEHGTSGYSLRCQKAFNESVNGPKGSEEALQLYTQSTLNALMDAATRHDAERLTLSRVNKTLYPADSAIYCETVANAFSNVPQLAQLLRYFSKNPGVPLSSSPPSMTPFQTVVHSNCTIDACDGHSEVQQEWTSDPHSSKILSARPPVQQQMTCDNIQKTSRHGIVDSKDLSTWGKYKAKRESDKLNLFSIPNLLDSDTTEESTKCSGGADVCTQINAPERFNCSMCNRSYSTQTGLSRHQAHKHSNTICNVFPLNGTLETISKRPIPPKVSKLQRITIGQKARVRSSQPLELRIGKTKNPNSIPPISIKNGYSVNKVDCSLLHLQAKPADDQTIRPFSCHICTKIYYSMSALKMHVRTHTLPCKCGLCGKAFSRMWLLNGHLRTHTGEKPFACSVCTRAFADRSNLRAHMQTHSEVKRYQCTRCNRTFSRMGLLTKHQSTLCGSISTGSEVTNRTTTFGSGASLDVSETTRASNSSNDN